MSTPVPWLNLDCAPFPTLDAIKAQLGITGTDQDVAITNTLSATVAKIESYLGRGIYGRQRTQRVEPIDTRDGKLFLYLFPITEVTSISVDGSPIATGWRVFGGQGIVELRNGCCWYGPRGCCAPESIIEITFTGGFPGDCWPPDLLDAVLSTFYRRWNATAGDISNEVATGAVKSWSADGLAVTMGDVSAGLGSISGDTIPPDLIPVAAQLDPYRLRFIRGV